MIRLTSIRLLLTKGRSFATVTDCSLPLLYRDLMVFDDTTEWTNSDDKWSQTMQIGAEGKRRNLKDPSSKHIVAKYSLSLFNNSNYHFNSVGEFSLNISACHFHHYSASQHLNTKLGAYHSIMIWPERLLIRNLIVEDIPIILKAVLDTNPKSATASKLQQLLNKEAIIADMPPIVIFNACNGSPGFSLQRAKQSLDLFKSASIEANKECPTLVFVEDFKHHRNGTNLMICNSKEEAREDCFELQLSLSKDKIKDLLAKY